MFLQLSYFENVTAPSNLVKIRCADNLTLFGTHSGCVRLNVKSRNDDTSTIVLNNALYVPGLTCALLSEDCIACNDAYNITFSANFVDIIDVKTGQIVFSGCKHDRMKWVPVQIVKTKSSAMFTSVTNSAHGTLSAAD